jgi:hypothetical protein
MIWIASRLLARKNAVFSKKDIQETIRNEFGDYRSSISKYISRYCVASTRGNSGRYHYLSRVGVDEYRLYQELHKTDYTKKDALLRPNVNDIPEKYYYLLDEEPKYQTGIKREIPIFSTPVLYSFQKDSIEKIINSVSEKNNILLSIPQGSGRTLITAEAIKELIKSTVKKPLFITDRKVLLDQFSLVFNRYNLKNIQLNTETLSSITNGSFNNGVILTTKAFFTNNHEQIPSNYFDLILIDELHKVSNATWKIIENKESTIVGFTSTPSALIENDILTHFKKEKPIPSFGISVLKFKEIAEVFSGAPYRSNVFSETGKINFYRPRDIVDNELILASARVSEEFLESNSKYSLKEGDILLQNVFDFNKMTLVEKENLPALASNNLFVIRSKRIDPKFLFNYLQSETILQELQSKLESSSTGATIKRITISRFREIEIPIPNSEKQLDWFTNIYSYSLDELLNIRSEIFEIKKFISENNNQEGGRNK